MIEEIEQEIAREDSTPSVLEQAKAQGWEAGYYHFGKAENDGSARFNPAIIERPDGNWLLVRQSDPHPQGFRFGQNKLVAFLLDETGKVPRRGDVLKWLNSPREQQFEDPRGFYHPDVKQVIIGACTFIWYPEGSWTGAHQIMGAFDEAWNCKSIVYPQIGGNPGQLQKITDPTKFEKNWVLWLHEGQLHILYKAKPWLVIGFGHTWREKTEYRFNEGVNWPYGELRGGTTPVKVGKYYFTFPHSSLPWKGRYRRYYAGAIAFDAEPPFRPRLITPEPILRGSQNDDWVQRKPLVVFPCGAIYRNDTWLVSAGINDLRSAWFEIPHEFLLKLMRPINEVDQPIFSQNGLSEEEERKEKLRARAAHARSVLAQKREAGLFVKKPRRGMKRRRASNLVQH